MSPVGPGANSDAAKLQHLVVGLRWKRVRISSDRLVLHAANICVRARTGNASLAGGLETRSYIPKNRLIVEDSLCAPGSPMLRSKDAARYLVS
jgi:hypothetical protein